MKLLHKAALCITMSRKKQRKSRNLFLRAGTLEIFNKIEPDRRQNDLSNIELYFNAKNKLKSLI